MKTPIQEFYEFMEQHQYFIGNDLYEKHKELLKKEKEVIMQALNDGKAMAVGNKENQSLEYYYNTTFNTKEK